MPVTHHEKGYDLDDTNDEGKDSLGIYGDS